MAPSLEEIKSHPFVVGNKQTIRAVYGGKAVVCFVASDASDYMKEQVISACEACGVPYEAAEDMKTLGKSCGIARGASSAAIIQPN